MPVKLPYTTCKYKTQGKSYGKFMVIKYACITVMTFYTRNPNYTLITEYNFALCST